MTKFLKNVDVTGYVSQTSVTSSLVKTDSSGKLVAAVAGTDYATPGALASADKMVTIGRNATGATLYQGTVVYISGSTGNRPNFVKAQANGESTSAGTFGVVLADIPNNSDGNVVTVGAIDNLDTRAGATNPFTSDTLVDGDTIYLSPTTAGYITRVKPSAPNHIVYVGKVVRTSPTNGTIVYRIQNGYELDEIHDVAISSLANNQGLFYESATDLWKNKTIATVLGYTPADDAAVVKLTGNQTVAGVKTFTSALLANNPSGGATGEGLVVGQSFKIDGSGTSQRAVMYVVSNVLSDTYGSGLQAQYANLADDKAFGFNLNTAGGFELYVKNTSFGKALAIANTMAATFGDSVTATSFIKTSGTSAQFLKADGSVDSSTYLTSYTETDTLATVTGRGAITNTQISISASTLQHLVLADRFHLIGGSNFHLTNNAYYSSAFKYKTANQVNKLTLQSDGTFLFDYAASGTIDANITWTTLFSISNTGTATASSFVRSGGTSAQFLKADGSVDSSTYLTTATAAATYLPLAGGTLTGALGGTTATFSNTVTSTATTNNYIAQSDGTSAIWRGRILSKNATADLASFLGTYGSVAGVFSHNNALSAWAALYVNNVDGTNGGAVYLPTSSYVAGNAIVHAGNIASQSVSSATTVTHYSGRTDSASYNVVWASGNPSHMYSCDAVKIQSSTGTLSATTFSGALSGNATTSTYTTYVSSPDGTRNPNTFALPNSVPNSVQYDFANAGSVTGATGNYAGVMTYAPWDGTSASTGDSSYQLAFCNFSGVNASGLPGLALRNGINSGWNATWYQILHSGNYSSYAIPLTGGTISGTLTVTGGGTNGPTIGINARDVTAARSATTGVIYLGSDGGHYVYYNGTDYVMPGGNLVLNGSTVLHSGNYSSYAVPLSGGTMSGGLVINAPSNTVGGALQLYSTTYHQYLQIYSNGGIEAMVNFRNNAAQWYIGLRTTTQLVGTDGFHFYNTGSAQTVGGYTNAGVHYCIGSAFANGIRLVENAGTWSINVTGNADSASVSTRTYGVYLDSLGTGSTNVNRGYTCVLRNENGSGGNGAYAPVLHLGGSDTMWQIQGAYGGDTWLKWRSGYAGTWYTWWTILHEGNQPYAYSMNQHVRTTDSPSFQEGTFGTTGGANNQGIQIRYQNYSSGYGRIRFYQSDSNHMTIHAFSDSWQGGGFGTGNSAGAINIDGGAGVTFGDWNSCDAYIASGGAGWFRGSLTATSFFESSDATIKTLIIDNYQAKGIESVAAKLYIKNGKQELGYYAQDLQDILPSSVTKGDNGLLNLSYREVHTAKIARLEKEVEELKSQLARL